MQTGRDVECEFRLNSGAFRGLQERTTVVRCGTDLALAPAAALVGTDWTRVCNTQSGCDLQVRWDAWAWAWQVRKVVQGTDVAGWPGLGAIYARDQIAEDLAVVSKPARVLHLMHQGKGDIFGKWTCATARF